MKKPAAIKKMKFRKGLQKNKSLPPLVEEHLPSGPLLCYMQKFQNVALVDDNARIHRTQVFFRIEVTSDTNKDSKSCQWCPKSDSVVGFASSRKDRWGLQANKDPKNCRSCGEETKFGEEKEEEETSSEFFLRMPNRRVSVDYFGTNDPSEQERQGRSKLLTKSKDSMMKLRERSKSRSTSPKRPGNQNATWGDHNNKNNTSDRQRLISKHSKMSKHSKFALLGGRESSPTRNQAPCAPMRAKSPDRPRREKQLDTAILAPMRSASISSDLDGSISDSDVEREDDDCDGKVNDSDASSGALQSPSPEFIIPLEVPRFPPRRQGSNDTLTSNDSSSFRRQAPKHTNSFELTHRRSAVRKAVRRRAIKMTPEELQSRFLDILLTDADFDDDDNDSDVEEDCNDLLSSSEDEGDDLLYNHSSKVDESTQTPSYAPGSPKPRHVASQQA